LNLETQKLMTKPEVFEKTGVKPEGIDHAVIGNVHLELRIWK